MNPWPVSQPPPRCTHPQLFILREIGNNFSDSQLEHFCVHSGPNVTNVILPGMYHLLYVEF